MEDPIKHVVLLMLENHSYDEMLGCFGGLDPQNPNWNLGNDGTKVVQREKSEVAIGHDPKHETANVRFQLEDGNANFVRDFENVYGNGVNERSQIMGFYPEGYLPALHALAQDFSVCDRWFSSLPGPTWPNRFFAISGTSSGRVLMPEGLGKLHLETMLAQTQATIFNRLDEATPARSWRIYYYDFPSSLIFKQLRTPSSLAKYCDIKQFFGRDAPGPAGEFPEFAFIEPKYFGNDQNDDHPSHSVMKAEKLIGDVFNAIRSNEPLWNSTLLVVLFDEHGGFYDHVVPPAAVPPDDMRGDGFDFDRYGVRVPALLVSPYVERGINHTLYDHTSLLKYLIDKWKLGPLGARTASANSVAEAITRATPRTDGIRSIRVPFGVLIQDAATWEDIESTEHQEALHLVVAVLEAEGKGFEGEALRAFVEASASVASRWVRLKAWAGRQISWVGRYLTRDHHARIQERLDKLNSVTARLMMNAPRGPIPPPGN